MDAKVPQRIDMEDRVIGPLTLPQFLYLLFGGLIIYILNSWIPSGSAVRLFFYVVSLPVFVLTIALAFIKIQDRPFIYFLGSLVRYLFRPRRRVWLKGQYNHTQVIVAKPKEVEPTAPKKDFNPNRAADLAKLLDTRENGQ